VSLYSADIYIVSGSGTDLISILGALAGPCKSLKVLESVSEGP